MSRRKDNIFQCNCTIRKGIKTRKFNVALKNSKIVLIGKKFLFSI